MSPTTFAHPDALGGRLELLAPEGLDDAQRQAYELTAQMILPQAEQGGFTVRLDDGRLIGPFNALLRVPGIAMAMGGWVRAIAAAGLPMAVRQVVILTVAAHWAAAFEFDAHSSAARSIGIPQEAIDAIADGRPPAGLDPDATLAHRLSASLLRDRSVDDDLYREALDTFGEARLVALLCLVGQYQTVCSMLVCFDVPVPTPA